MNGAVGRYIIGQMLGPFGLFSLIFLGVVWLTQSLRVIDTVVNNGQSALVFAEFTALLLPTVMSMILPVAGFAASLYALNRMFMDSEIVVLMAAGMSRVRLALPVAGFGLMVALAMSAVTLYLMPTSAREMRDRIAEVNTDLANALIREGEFIHPAGQVTVFIRATSDDGQMAGLFVQDDRDADARVTYTARRAAMVRTEDGPRLVMFDGAAQRVDPSTKELSTLSFEKLVYDLSSLVDSSGERQRKPSEHYAWELVTPSEEVLQGRPPGKFVAEGHEQISAPLYAVTLPLIALAALLAPGFRRRGYGKRIAAGIALAALCRVAGVACKSMVSGAPELWPSMYLPPILGALLALWALWAGLPRLSRPVPPASLPPAATSTAKPGAAE
ncbi:LPS export ABC transporter permease LptF [Rhodovulum sp. DZ06]|uniref:LPS export ABC transporter permease LptF n=1 Tax=Rhodovulum sp. DZ06 TaxID=3425126 RepID=UPI003D3352AC